MSCISHQMDFQFMSDKGAAMDEFVFNPGQTFDEQLAELKRFHEWFDQRPFWVELLGTPSVAILPTGPQGKRITQSLKLTARRRANGSLEQVVTGPVVEHRGHFIDLGTESHSGVRYCKYCRMDLTEEEVEAFTHTDL